MGRLDDIVARNKKASRQGVGTFGLIGAVIDATNDPTDTPEDKRRKMLAWAIVGGVIAAIVVLVAIAY